MKSVSDGKSYFHVKTSIVKTELSLAVSNCNYNGDRTEPIFVKEHITTNNYNFIAVSLTPLKAATLKLGSSHCVLCHAIMNALSNLLIGKTDEYC